MKHIDLFSGIGGFALACEWNGIETILFCDNNRFCEKVLKKHWPDVPIVEDVNDIEKIKQIVADTAIRRCEEYRAQSNGTGNTGEHDLLLTAGFPCQPFSSAGRKRGANDDRYLWPQTFAVIEAIKPDWIILENVAGLLGMVFPDNEVRVANQTSLFGNEDEEIADYNTIIGRIESDLRQAGYETVWLVIPACSLGAPHRRDRVWVVANSSKIRCRQWSDNWEERCIQGDQRASPQGQSERQGWFGGTIKIITNIAHTSQQGLQGEQPREPIRLSGQCDREWGYKKPGWTENWYEVATRFCRVDDGVPNRVDRLKSLGNAIVPQVAYEIIKAIKEANK